VLCSLFREFIFQAFWLLFSSAADCSVFVARFRESTPSGRRMPDTDVIAIHEESGCFVAELEGPRISEGPIVAAMQERLTQLLADDPQKKILIDFRQIELMSSATLGVLVRLYRDLSEQGGRIVLCGLQPPVRKTFELTKLDQLFRIEPDTAAGLARLCQ